MKFNLFSPPLLHLNQQTRTGLIIAESAQSQFAQNRVSHFASRKNKM
jgi:hypothetical protein